MSTNAEIKARALQCWHFIVSDDDREYLDPRSLKGGRVVFREGKPICGNCGREVMTGRRQAGDATMLAPRLRAGTLACAGCGKVYEVHQGDEISDADAAHLGLNR